MSLSLVTSRLSRSVVASLFTLLSVVTGFTQSAEKTTENALLWEISGNGMQKPSYLYGTMHVSGRVAFHLPESFFTALKSTEVVALEINPDNFAEEVLNSARLYNTGDLQYYSRQTFWRSAFNASIPSSYFFRMLLSKEDDFANYLLYRTERGNQDFQEDTYLDLFIYQSGKKLGKKVDGLERLSETFELALKSRADETARGDDDMEYVWDGNPYEALEEAYRAGNLTMIDSISRGSQNKNFREYMLFRRNENMVNRMDSIFKSGSLFAGVGAAHLPGEKGMLNLLRKKGYTVKPVINDGSRSAMKEKLEETIYRQSFVKHVAEDSLFEFSTPGKVFAAPDYAFGMPGLNETFCADMVNGGFYSIIRKSTFGTLKNVSAEDYLKKVDSLLFENIPGKIVKKKKFTDGDITGFDIWNVTRAGNRQRYKIYFTPLEIIVFKVSGLKDYANKVGVEFFNSIKFRQRAAEWTVFKPEGTGFSVNMPGYYIKRSTLNADSKKANDFVIQSTIRSSGKGFIFYKASYHDFSSIEPDSVDLLHLGRNFLRKLDFKLNSRKIFAEGKRTVAEFTGEDEKENKVWVKVLIAGTDYFLLATDSDDAETRKKFFSSLVLSDKSYSEKFISVKDTIYGFTVTAPSGSYDFSEKKNKINLFSADDKKEKHKYFSKEEKLYFVSASTSELIEVGYNKFSDFFAADKLKFREDVKSFISGNGDLKISREHWKDSSDASFILTDTSSSRGIRARVIHSGSDVFILKADIDTLVAESRFISEFFNTFKPLQQKNNAGLFADKTGQFFEACNSSDTILVYTALRSLPQLDFKKNDFVKLTGILNNEKHAKQFSEKNDIKLKLIDKIAKLQSAESDKFIKELYEASSDSVDIQMQILESLAENKTAASYKMLSDLMKSGLPFPQEYQVGSLFRSFEDSLEVSAGLYPDMLQYTRYPEYKEYVYDLLATLKDSGVVSHKVYESRKAEIIRDAEEEIKRRSSAPDHRNNYYSSVNISAGNLTSFFKLLIPYYNEPQVKSLFEKSLKMKDKNVVLSVSTVLLKAEKPVEDSILHSCIKKDAYRILIYKKLKELNRLDKFDNKYYTQENFCKSFLSDNYSGQREGDSVVFVTRRKATVGGKDGYVYFFKRKKEKDKNWKLEYAGLQPMDSSQVNIENTFRYGHIKFTEKELDKTVDKCMDDLEFKNIGKGYSGYSGSFVDFLEERSGKGNFSSRYDSHFDYDYYDDYSDEEYYPAEEED